MISSTQELLSPAFITRLDQLSLVSRKMFAGKLRGERLTKRRGESVEFADFRNYVSGDDLRHLDWNIYARLDRLFIKLFLQEEDLHVNILLDISKSMDCGDPNKALYARQVAAAVAYIGLCNFDRVSILPYSNGLHRELSGIRGRKWTFKVMQFLSELTFDRPSNFAAAAKQFALRHPQPGIVLIVSDFLDKAGFEDAFRFLVGRKYDVYALHVLSPEEIDPVLAGDLRLTDVEDDDVAEITVSSALLNRYRRTLEVYCRRLKEYCTKRGMNYLFTSTDVPFDQIILSYFRQRGLIQ